MVTKDSDGFEKMSPGMWNCDQTIILSTVVMGKIFDSFLYDFLFVTNLRRHRGCFSELFKEIICIFVLETFLAVMVFSRR